MEAVGGADAAAEAADDVDRTAVPATPSAGNTVSSVFLIAARCCVLTDTDDVVFVDVEAYGYVRCVLTHFLK